MSRSDPAEPYAHAHDSRTPSRVLWAYAAPALTSSVLFAALSLYLLKYSTDVLLIPPAAVGSILAIGRLWDALTDPVVGHSSDRTRSRFGRRRPWLLASALPIAASYVAIWTPPASLTVSGLTLWLGAALLLFYTAITVFGVPHLALGAELSADPHERSRVFAAKALGDHVGIVIAAASLLVLENAAAPRGAATAVALLSGVAMVGAILFATFSLREPPDHQGRGGSRSPYAAFADVWLNRNARLLLGVFFFELLGYQTFVTMLPYVTQYVLEAPGSTAYYLFGAIAAMLIALPAWAPLSRRFGKVQVWKASLALKLATFAAFGLVGPGDAPWIAALTVIFGATNGGSAVLGPSLKADVIDSDEARTGERKEGTFFSAWGFVSKGAIGIAIALSGYALSGTGFRPNEVQTPEALTGIRGLVSAFPMVCHVLALLLLGRLRMNESRQLPIRSEIEAGRRGVACAPATEGELR